MTATDTTDNCPFYTAQAYFHPTGRDGCRDLCGTIHRDERWNSQATISVYLENGLASRPPARR